jgi:hypothetical protein
MQGFEVSGEGVRRVSGNGSIFCRTVDRTPTGHLVKKDNENKEKALSGQVSGGVRQVPDVRCLSGVCVPRTRRPDTRPDRQVFETPTNSKTETAMTTTLVSVNAYDTKGELWENEMIRADMIAAVIGHEIHLVGGGIINVERIITPIDDVHVAMAGGAE